jgi:hypothetical protein
MPDDRSERLATEVQQVLGEEWVVKPANTLDGTAPLQSRRTSAVTKALLRKRRLALAR